MAQDIEGKKGQLAILNSEDIFSALPSEVQYVQHNTTRRIFAIACFCIILFQKAFHLSISTSNILQDRGHMVWSYRFRKRRQFCVDRWHTFRL